MALYTGFIQLGAGLSVGLAGLSAGFAIGIVGDAGVRGVAQQVSLSISNVRAKMDTDSPLSPYSPEFSSEWYVVMALLCSDMIVLLADFPLSRTDSYSHFRVRSKFWPSRCDHTDTGSPTLHRAVRFSGFTVSLLRLFSTPEHQTLLE